MVGITLGDPAGIGPEIVLKALPHFAHRRVLLIGSARALQQTAERLGLVLPPGLRMLDDGSDFRFSFGRVQQACGAAALRALETGARLLGESKLSGLVTAPVSKLALRRAGFVFPGQTEFLAARLKAREYGMLAYVPSGSGVERRGPGKAVRIAFVTIHQPLAEVPSAVTAGRVAGTLRLLDKFLRRHEHVRSPRIAVLALNPHGREFTLGEEARISQGIRLVSGIRAEGPFPADTIGRLLERYDAIAAMYHDQAMIPAKLLGQGQGVNLTMGLPRIRTSPLHGTAFDIAGKGIADPDSMIAAIRVCLRLAVSS